MLYIDDYRLFFYLVLRSDFWECDNDEPSIVEWRKLVGIAIGKPWLLCRLLFLLKISALIQHWVYVV